jgi:hypothetical protein
LIYGIAPLPPLGPYWISTSFVPTLVMMVLFNNLQKRSVDRFVFARLQDCHGALRAALLTAVFFRGELIFSEAGA